MTTMTYQQLVERAAMTALDLHKASTATKALKAELRSLYDTYFQAHGRPEGKFDPDNDAFLPVMMFTNAQYGRVQAAKKAEYNARRRHERAVASLAAACECAGDGLHTHDKAVRGAA